MYQEQGDQSPPEMRAWMLGAGVAMAQVLANLAEGHENTADLRATFSETASIWADAQREELAHSRPLRRARRSE
jgi:hypothetical protein